MNYTDEEMDLLNEAHDKRKRFHVAKENRESDPEEYAEAKADMSEHRSLWRGIRDYEAKPLPQDEDADGTAAADAVGLSSGVQQGTKAELYEQAQELDIEGRSDMTKDELAKAIKEEG